MKIKGTLKGHYQNKVIPIYNLVINSISLKEFFYYCFAAFPSRVVLFFFLSILLIPQLFGTGTSVRQ